MPQPNSIEKTPPATEVKATANEDGSVTIEGELPPGFPRRLWIIERYESSETYERWLLSAEQFPTVSAASEEAHENGEGESPVRPWTKTYETGPEDPPKVLTQNPRELEQIVKYAIEQHLLRLQKSRK